MTQSISIARIARLLGVERESLLILATKAEHLYRHWRKTTGRKNRIFSEPAEELKQIQRELTAKVLSTLPISSASYSVRGRGVILSAAQHQSAPYMYVLDLANCFPATGFRLIQEALTRAGLTKDAAELVTKLVTVKRALPQGAPTSSIVLDIVLYDLDEEFLLLAERYSARYVRYADDLCFSGARDLTGLARRARRMVRGRGFSINERKTKLTGPGNRHLVTGIVVTDELNPRPGYIPDLSAELRRAKRDPRVRKIKTLRGQTAWVAAVNPARGRQIRKDNRWLFEENKAKSDGGPPKSSD